MKKEETVTAFESYTGDNGPIIKELSKKDKLKISKMFENGIDTHILKCIDNSKMQIKFWIVEANKKIKKFKDIIIENDESYEECLSNRSYNLLWNLSDIFFMHDKTTEKSIDDEINIYKKLIDNQEKYIKYISSIEYQENIEQRIINIEINKAYYYFLQNEFDNKKKKEK